MHITPHNRLEPWPFIFFYGQSVSVKNISLQISCWFKLDIKTFRMKARCASTIILHLARKWKKIWSKLTPWKKKIKIFLFLKNWFNQKLFKVVNRQNFNFLISLGSEKNASFKHKKKKHKLQKKSKHKLQVLRS